MNASSPEWKRRVEIARAELLQHPHFDVPYTHTMRLFTLLGPRLNVDYEHPERWLWEQQDPLAVAGWQRRAWNSLLCLEKVIHLGALPGLNVDYAAFVRDAKAVVRAKAPHQVVLLQRKYMPVSGDDVNHTYEQESKTSTAVDQAVGVYIAMEHVSIVVGGDVREEFDPDVEEWVEGDHWSTPTVVFVADIVGGNHFDLSPRYLNDAARRAFWEWWLDVALPSSWDLRDL